MSLGVLSRSHLGGDFNSFHARALLGADSHSSPGCCDETSMAEGTQPPQGREYSLWAWTCP